jgi:hypothetical protein
MTTLRVEHPISSYEVWRAAFDRFAEARERAGVTAFAVRTLADDPLYLVLDLEFADRSRAEAFERFLRTQVWSSPASAPGLAGSPVTRLLEPVAG